MSDLATIWIKAPKLTFKMSNHPSIRFCIALLALLITSGLQAQRVPTVVTPPSNGIGSIESAIPGGSSTQKPKSSNGSSIGTIESVFPTETDKPFSANGSSIGSIGTVVPSGTDSQKPQSSSGGSSIGSIQTDILNSVSTSIIGIDEDGLTHVGDILSQVEFDIFFDAAQEVICVDIFGAGSRAVFNVALTDYMGNPMPVTIAYANSRYEISTQSLAPGRYGVFVDGVQGSAAERVEIY